tara:strand:- start:2014 stop:3066 length:1053 start_codon:yes stop_codon:yes gene_type:complete
MQTFRPVQLILIWMLCVMWNVQSVADTKPIEWRMSSAFPGSALQLGTLGREIARNITDISDNRLKVAFIEPNVIERPFRLFDAVSKDKLEAAWATPSYWFQKDPAFALFSSVPFGPDPLEFTAWMSYGGGAALRDELYEPHGLISIVCGAMAPEAGGWFRREIRQIEDFRGLKMRAFCLGAQVLQKLGMNPQLIAHDKLHTALQDGSLDAAEFSMPAIDTNLRFDQVRQLYYYFPGWHQQTTLFELLISQSAWLALPRAQQAQVRTACAANLARGIAQGEALQARAILDIRERGTEIRKFPPQVLNGLEKAWLEVAAELSAKSKNFARIWAAQTRFREEYRVWRELGYLR